MEIDLLADPTAVDVMSDGDGGDADTSPVYYHFEPSVRETSDGNRSTFVISTVNEDRYRSIIEPKGINLTYFKKNPVVKFDHGFDIMRGELPVAKAVDTQKRDDGIISTVEWWTDEFSTNVRAMVKSGFLNAASIGFIPLAREWKENEDGSRTLIYKKIELLEFSIVSIPANRESLVQQRGFQPAWMREFKERMDRLEAALQGSPRTTIAVNAAKLAEIFGQGVTDNPDSIMTIASMTTHSPAEAKAEAAPDDSATPATAGAAALSVPEQPQEDGRSAAAATAPAAAKPEPGMVGRFIQLNMHDLRTFMAESTEEARRVASVELKRQLGRA